MEDEWDMTMMMPLLWNCRLGSTPCAWLANI